MTGFSGQTVFDSWVMTFFNMVFTALPIMAFAIFDKDLDEEFLLKFPELYSRSRRNIDFNFKTFFLWIVNAVAHSLICFFGTWALWTDGVLDDTGHIFGLWSFGMIITTAIVVLVTLKIASVVDNWTIFAHITIWGSLIVYFLFLLPYSAIAFLTPKDFLGLFFTLGAVPNFWFIWIVLTTVCLLGDISVHWIYNYVWPSNRQIFRELKLMSYKNGFKKNDKTKLLNGDVYKSLIHSLEETEFPGDTISSRSYGSYSGSHSSLAAT
mmetsp:Transcript_23456/g.26039  ORF Transcript_23456/g.26039 Transcript_23456/m.26039 type:complete len:266 (+) Transcript_23456:68-865(+)